MPAATRKACRTGCASNPNMNLNLTLNFLYCDDRKHAAPGSAEDHGTFDISYRVGDGEPPSRALRARRLSMTCTQRPASKARTESSSLLNPSMVGVHDRTNTLISPPGNSTFPLIVFHAWKFDQWLRSN